MKKSIFSLVALMSFCLLGQAALTQDAQAVSLNGFQAENIISDEIFTDTNTMNASQIQNFLEAKNSVCLKDLKIQSLHDENGDGLGDEPYGKGVNAKVSAATVIYQAAQLYGINPQVILVTLQKEQGLITRTDCPQWRYNTALGYGCPDTAPCDDSAYGFTRQIDYGVWHFRGFFDDTYPIPPTVPGSKYIAYNPSASCGGKTITIQNRATAALYSYTPYQPNQAVRDAAWGELVDCGAYGNTNFYRYFTSWFGSTHHPGAIAIYKRYAELGGASGKLGAATKEMECGLVNKGCYQNYENGAILWTEATGAWESLGSIRSYWMTTGWEVGKLGYPTGPETAIPTGGWKQSYEKGVILGSSITGYWESKGSIRNRWISLGGLTGSLGYPIGPEVAIPGGWKQSYQNGVILGKPKTGYWETSTPIFDRYDKLGEASGKLGYPIKGMLCDLTNDGCYQNYENGAILWTEATGAWESLGSIRAHWITTGWERGSLGYPTGPETAIPTGGWQQTYERGTIQSKNGTISVTP